MTREELRRIGSAKSYKDVQPYESEERVKKMDRNEIRQIAVSGIDDVLNGAGRFFMNAEKKKLLRATRNVILGNDMVVDLLLSEYQKLPLSKDDEENDTSTKERKTMTAKKQGSGSEQSKGLEATPEQRKQMEGLGLDFGTLLAGILKLSQNLPELYEKGKAVFDLLVKVFTVTEGRKGKKTTVAEGCCDHEACCMATLEATLEAARVAAEHYCQCCCEEECPTPDDQDEVSE